MNTYLFRKERSGGVFKTWQYDEICYKAKELPPTPAGFKLFTITKPR